MKKALIIANMMFASVTVFGMVPNNGDNPQTSRGAVFDMTKTSSKKDVGSPWTEIIDGYGKFFNTAKNGYTPMQVAKKKEELKVKCLKSFRMAQSGLKNNKWVQDEIKQILSRVTPEDISQYIEECLILNSSEVDSFKVEKSAKEKAKDFFCLSLIGKTFNQYTKIKESEKNPCSGLEDPELREYLLNIALKTIDSAKCIRDSHSANSFAREFDIECYYRKEEDLILFLVHETAHVLDLSYGAREKFGQSNALEMFENRHNLLEGQKETSDLRGLQKEYVSIFFETLLVTDYFRKNLGNSCSQKFRIWDFFKTLLECDLVRELADSYGENALLYGLIINGHINQISELKENVKIGSYIDIYQELRGVLTGAQFDKNQKEIWRNLKEKLDNKKDDKNCLKLRQWLYDLEKGQCSVHKVSYVKGDVFTFSRDSKQIKKSFPDTNDFDWKQICNWIKNEREKNLLLTNLLQNPNCEILDILIPLYRRIDECRDRIVAWSFTSLEDGKLFELETIDSEPEGFYLPQFNENDWDKIKNLINGRLESIPVRRYVEGLLDVLNNVGYKELSQLFRDTLEGKSELINHEPNKDILAGFVFLKDQKQTVVGLPDLDGVDFWLEIKDLMKKYSPLAGKYWFSLFVKSAVNLALGNTYGCPIDEHTSGVCNAFKMFKENNYEQMLKDGKPLPVKDIMEKLTKPGLSWTKESIKKFYDFLKTEKIVSLDRMNKLMFKLIKESSGTKESDIEFLNEVKEYKPLDITKESAEELLEFLRRQ